MRIEYLPVDKIRIEEHPRSDDNLDKGFQDTIKEHGLIYPIVVSYSNVLIDGKRRLLALKKQSKKEVLVIKVGKKEKPELELILNLQRKDLNPIDKAKAFKKFIEIRKISIRQASKVLGISKSTIEYHLKLLELPEELQEDLKEKKVKPYALEKMVYKKRVKTKKDFQKFSTETQYRSVLNRITSLKTFLRHTKLKPYQLINLREKILDLVRILDELIMPLPHKDFVELEKETWSRKKALKRMGKT